MYETIAYEKTRAVADIALNRPKRLNAFDLTMHPELLGALNAAAEDEEVRSIVLRGEGRGFSAGADLSDMVERDGGDPDLGAYLRETYGRLVTRMVEIEKPIIASLHGPVYGAGLGVALACDLRVAAESARFSVAFVKIGLMPDAGVTYFLPRIVGLGRAVQMSMLGEPVGAAEALQTGLVNRVVPDEELADATAALAARLAALPTRAIGTMKKALQGSFDGDLAAALEVEARGQTYLGYTADHKEGVAAFLEKREADFKGE